MIYRTYEHYDFDIPIEYNTVVNTNECFVCYELMDLSHNPPISLDSQNIYIKLCQCDGYIHNGCLKRWYNKNKKCPICRVLILEDYDPIYKYLGKNSYIYYVSFRYKTRILSYLIIPVFFYLMCNIYISLFVSIYMLLTQK